MRASQINFPRQPTWCLGIVIRQIRPSHNYFTSLIAQTTKFNPLHRKAHESAIAKSMFLAKMDNIWKLSLTFHRRLWVHMHLKIHFHFVFKIWPCEQRHSCFDLACTPLNHIWPGLQVVCLRTKQVWISVF